MKNKFWLLIALVILWGSPAFAAPRWLTAVPRAVGRSYGNMFTFKHPWVAVQQWATVGAIAFNEEETQATFRRCPHCVENNPTSFYYHRQTGTGGAIVDGLILVTIETTWMKYASEIIEPTDTRTWRNAYSIVPSSFIAAHVYAGIHDSKVGK